MPGAARFCPAWRCRFNAPYDRFDRTLENRAADPHEPLHVSVYDKHSEARDAALAYWRQQLHEPLPVLELPPDRPRTAALSFHTARQSFRLPGELVQALTRLCRREGSTLCMTLLAAFKILLYISTQGKETCAWVPS